MYSGIAFRRGEEGEKGEKGEGKFLAADLSAEYKERQGVERR